MFRRTKHHHKFIKILSVALILSLCPVWSFGETEGYAPEGESQVPSQSEMVTEPEQIPEGDLVTENTDEITPTEEPVQEETIPEVQPDKGIMADDSVVPGPSIVSWKYKSPTSAQLTWKKTGDAAGYEIQADSDKDFDSPALIEESAEGADTTSLTIDQLEPEHFYYVRIRSYKQLPEGNKEFSAWTLHSTKGSNFKTTAKAVKSSGKTIDFHAYLPSKTRKVYRVLQGSATDGTYMYLFYEAYYGNKCVILKVRADNFKKFAVSAPLVLDHANDATYDPDDGLLYVVHWDGHPFRVSKVDPDTLRIVGYKDIKPEPPLPGASEHALSTLSGFAGIAYSETRKQFVMRCSVKGTFLILDEDLEPIRYCKRDVTLSERPQSLDCDADHIYACYDKSGSYNVVAVFDWNGKFEHKVRVPLKYEIEGIVKVGGKCYANFYYGHYVKKYKTKRVKWKKVNGKWKYKTKYVYKKVKKRVKWKKVNGKWKYKKKKVKVRKTYWVYVRQSFTYKLGTI